MCPIKIRIEVYFNTNPRRRFQFRANNSPVLMHTLIPFNPQGPKGTTKNPPLKNRTYTEYPGQLRKTWSVISTPPPHIGHIAFASSRL
ncbi:hypothetical protein V6Z11_D03G169300 [Gossypium hirsutum]